ncbi:MAG: ribulose-phosphate 3-epimerase [Bacteroidota bacterium]
MKKMIAPSVLSADFGNLERDIRMLNASAADFIHCDIMDGNFVPNISFGFPVLKAIAKAASKPLDVHLMIEGPDRYVDQFRAVGAEILTVHYENNVHLHRVLGQIREAGMRAGVALNPATPVEALRDLLPMLDLVLIMSVNPGFGGQKFIEQSYRKVNRIKEMRDTSSSDFLIEVDGGVKGHNAAPLFAAGADVLVAGSYVFGSDDPTRTIAELKGAETAPAK